MRIVAAMLLVAIGFSGMIAAASAQSSDCKKCREQQQACMKNYAGKTCKTEYDICIKNCKK